MKIPLFLPLYLGAMAALFLVGCGDKSTQPTQGTNVSGGSPPNAAGDYGGVLARGQAHALKTVDVASLNQAVQMFNVNEGRFPKDLNELVDAKLIAKIPTAPQGMKINYDPATGQVSIVSE